MVCPNWAGSAMLVGMDNPAIHAPISIQACQPSRYRDALRIVFSDLPEPARTTTVRGILATIQDTDPGTESLYIAQEEDTLHGAIWFQQLPGRTAVLMPPRLVDPARATADPLAGQLIGCALDQLQARGVAMVQILLRQGDTNDSQRIEAASFEPLTDLIYLTAATQTVSPPATGSLIFQPYLDDQRGRLGQLIERTYIGSLDCPALDGLREIEDVITGYQATGRYDPARWFFVRHADTDVGLLLLTSHAPARQWELVYMGLVPEARGQGWGEMITRFAVWRAGQGRAEQLVLAVDAANIPVRRIYERVGFSPWDHRTVWIRRLRYPTAVSRRGSE